jgi:hypothetical protein
MTSTWNPSRLGRNRARRFGLLALFSVVGLLVVGCTGSAKSLHVLGQGHPGLSATGPMMPFSARVADTADSIESEWARYGIEGAPSTKSGSVLFISGIESTGCPTRVSNVARTLTDSGEVAVTLAVGSAVGCASDAIPVSFALAVGNASVARVSIVAEGGPSGPGTTIELG